MPFAVAVLSLAAATGGDQQAACGGGGGMGMVPAAGSVAGWPAVTPDGLDPGVSRSVGNHRAAIVVRRFDYGVDAVIATVAWRRRDPAPELKDLFCR